ncbi:MAG: 4Fe-4S binding protein [Myxococcota bacterium]|nr:4Fe-4S binding protein [Myxococcota bacterium]
MALGDAKAVVFYLPPILSAVLLAAHFLRSGSPGLVITCLLAPLLMLIRRQWIPVVIQLLLVAAALEWVQTAGQLIQVRQALGQPFLRLAFILGGVAMVTAASTLVFQTAAFKKRYAHGKSTAKTMPSIAAFALTAIGLSIVQTRVSPPMLLLERFIPGGGAIEVLGFSVYAAWMTENLLDPKRAPTWRRRLWLAFSGVFFAQLILGMLVDGRFLMTGDLHLPVPAVIAAGPVFRGERFFMPILFAATTALVGPAWCSHLCYIGAWDHAASRRQRKPAPLPSWTRPTRVGVFFFVIAGALMLRVMGASMLVAGILGLTFGALGVGVMVLWSRRTGTMAHCLVYCPIGLIADWLGKLSPFRIRLGSGCTACGNCTKACRYDALTRRDIEVRRPGLTCTLCGDCLASCKEDQIGYRFFGIEAAGARIAFIVLVVSLHAVFMAVARV